MPATYVALDLETTGLDPEADAIIEIGAVKFTPSASLRAGSPPPVLDTFQTLVKPQTGVAYRPIPAAVQALTGLSDEHVRHAPILAVVAADLEAFLADCPLVGHNIDGFDARFLRAKGIRHSDLILDTQELAKLLLPGLPEYSLGALAQRFQISLPTAHRALPDALAAKDLFLALRKRLAQLPAEVLSQCQQWLPESSQGWRHLFQEALAEGRAPVAPFTLSKPSLPEPLEPHPYRRAVPPQEAASILASARERPDIIPEFEERPEQQTMTVAVAEALNEGHRLIVEAGTGTGKSLAYLVPAACYALANNARVVISTATINLQEQLTGKDIPALRGLLQGWSPAGGRAGPLVTAQLKGRSNYLCLRRFAAMQQSGPLSDQEGKLMVRLLLWLTQTETGDRSELRLSAQEEARWRRLSAEEASCQPASCPFAREGTCFLLRARRRAEAAHLLVVNHALLLTDVALGGHLLPPYENLIIDEAHHLEEEATRQLGFQAGEEEISETLDRLQRLAPDIRASLRGLTAALGPGGQLLGLAAAVAQASEGARPRLRELADALRAFLRQHAADDGGYDYRLLLNRAMRIQPDWSSVEVAWENLRLALANIRGLLERLLEALLEAEGLGLLNYELLVGEANALLQHIRGLSEGLAAVIERDDPERIAWGEEDRRDGSITLAWAPLEVAALLRERLYADKHSVVLTGATLAARPDKSGFEYIRQRLGLEDARELLLGSSFDYQRAALVLIPRDMPEPTSPDYLDTLAPAVVDLVRASQGRALVLFTSHASLRAAHALVKGVLDRQGIAVLGQGIDGPPKQLLQALRSQPRTVILGTASFWEGVDVVGEALSLLIMARLPFSVPTEPVFAARAALFEEPFSQYALPQAVLRFKQGFGRLIRSKSDRGVMVVLDGRIRSKRYGGAFLGSLPPCPLREAMLRELPALIARWLSDACDGEQDGGHLSLHR